MVSQKVSFINLIVISILLFLGSLFFSIYAPTHLVSKALLFLVPFFLITSMVSRIFISKALKKGRVKATNVFFIITTVKFFLYLSVMILYGFFIREDAIPFIISFFVFYLIYTFIDIKALTKISSQ